MKTAFDADVLIYAASDHSLGARIRMVVEDGGVERIGSVLLLTEVLAKSWRDDPDSEESRMLIALLSRLELRPLDARTARLALALSVSYGLRAADAAHLATAVAAGADRFLTNNRNDFPQSIEEIDIVYPDDLPA